MLFQTDIDKINTEIAQLEELIAAKQQRQSQLIHLQDIAEDAVKSVQNVICRLSSPDARVTLKSAVVGLFDDLNDSSETTSTSSASALVSMLESAPAPEVALAPASEDSEPESAEPATLTAASAAEPELIQVSELVSYTREANGEIQCTYVGFNNKGKAQSWGEWFTSSTVASSESCAPSIAHKFEVKLAVHLPFKYELLVWGLNQNQIEQLASLDFSKPPKVESGKAVERPLEISQLPDSTEGETDLSTEPLTESKAPTVSETNVNADLHSELAITENSSNPSISEDTASATPKPVLNSQVTGDVNRPAQEPTSPTATSSKVAPKLEDLEPDDIVGSLLVPDWTYKVLNVKANGQLSCERRLSSGQSFNVDLDINGVYLVEKAAKQVSELLIDTPVDQTRRGDGKTQYQTRRGDGETRGHGELDVAQTAGSTETVLGSKSSTAASDAVAPVQVGSPSPAQVSPRLFTEQTEPEPAILQADEPMTPLILANLIRAAWSWSEIEAATTRNEPHKKAAWSLLTQKEKDQVLALKLQAQQQER